jgi:predicted alpha/beta superfamily hydrolase
MTVTLFPILTAGVLLLAATSPCDGQRDTARIEVQVVGGRTVFVQLPPGYDRSDRRYAVLYTLDGSSTIVTAPPLVDSLVTAGSVPEVILVAIPHGDRRHDLTPTAVARYPTSGGGEQLLRFIADELIPHVDDRYRTQPIRVLHGHSLGGLFVVYALAAEPGLFQGYIASSPSLRWDDWIVRGMTARAFAQPAWVAFLFLGVGTDDLAGYADNAREFAAWLEAHAPDGLRWSLYVYEGGTHESVGILAFLDGLAEVFAALEETRR